MNILLRVSIVIALFLSSIGMPAFAELVYDPDTNSYINTNTSAESSIDDSTSTDTSDTSDEDVEQDQISSIGPSTTTSDSTQEESESDDTETEEEVVVDRDGTLQYMHIQVDDYVKDLHALLTKNYNDLRADAADLLSDGTTSRLYALQCLGIVDEDFDYLEDIVQTRITLENQIEIVKADLHSTITALESKIDKNLLTSLDKNLQIGSLQNKIDAYNAEFVNIIEMYYELSLDEVANADELIMEETSGYVEVVELYDERIALITSAEDAYSEFLKESSLAGSSSGPDLQSLLGLLDQLEVYYRATYIDKWDWEIGSHIPLNNITFLNVVRTQSISAFSAYFATQTDSMLNGLYPIDALQSINKRMVTLRSSYRYDNGSFDCKAVVENNAVETMAPALEKEMVDVLASMKQAAQSFVQSGGKIPKDADDLEILLAQAMSDYDVSDVDALIAQEKVRIQKKSITEGVNRLTTAYISQKTKRKRTVRNFLQENYKTAMEQQKLAGYTKKLQSAHTKVVTALSAGPTGATKQMLEAIKEVIEEFM